MIRGVRLLGESYILTPLMLSMPHREGVDERAAHADVGRQGARSVRRWSTHRSGTPLLFLDSYQVHKMPSVNAAINNLGVEVVIIPPGCTGLTQPVDVGYNKPFKNCVRDHYEEWMMEDGRDLRLPPRRVDVAKWVVAAEKNMTTTILRNSWNKKGLEYFDY